MILRRKLRKEESEGRDQEKGRLANKKFWTATRRGQSYDKTARSAAAV